MKTTNRPLIIVAEEIGKDIISTLVLNNIQKKFKVAVINYKSVKFDETIRIILIPSIYDDILKNLKKNLWYSEDDYKFFIDERKNILKRSKTMDNLIL